VEQSYAPPVKFSTPNLMSWQCCLQKLLWGMSGK